MEHIENATTATQRLLNTMATMAIDDDSPPTDGRRQAPAVLPADHPLLEKFQRALKAHLLKVNSELEEEVAALKQDIVQKTKDCNDVGSELYDLQEEAERQKDALDDYNTQLKEMNEKRSIHESNAKDLKKTYDHENYRFKDAKRAYNERLIELTHLQVLEGNMCKWTQEIEDEVIAAKRVVSKDAKDQLAVSQHKKQMDMILFNVDAEIRRVERQLENTNEQIGDQQQIVDELHRSIADANADVNALQNEHKRLIASWSDVILCIKQRDKQLAGMRQELYEQKQSFTTKKVNIAGTIKQAEKEMEENEKLESFRIRMEADANQIVKQSDKETAELNKLQNEIDTLNKIIEQTEVDQQKSTVEWHVYENQLKVLRRSIEKQLRSKQQLEEQILEMLQDQVTTDQASAYRSKMLRELQEKRRNVELGMLSTEQQLSQVMLDLERWKSQVAQSADAIQKLTKKQKDNNSAATARQLEITALKHSTNIKYKNFEAVNAQLMQLIEAAGGLEIDPTEAKFRAMEKNNAELDAEIRDAQAFWLRLQSHVVTLSEKRADQLNSIQLARKQMLVIAQKHLKIEADLEELKKQGRDTIRLVNAMYTKIDQTSFQLCEKKKFHRSEETECQLSHQALVERLKDEEMVVLKLEKDLVDMSRDIEDAKNEALEKHREALSWETKWKMANETKEYRSKEHDAAGEIGVMKAEIHRMEVRFLQLRRAQEKLATDMESCVLYRDNIFTSANIKNKMPDSKTKSRFTVLHRLNDVKNKIKLAQNEMSSVNRDGAEVGRQIESALYDIQMLENLSEEEKVQNQMLCGDIELAVLNKQENLDRIVLVQNRTRKYRSLLCSAKPLPRLRSETKLKTDATRQTEINDHLINVMNALLEEYPQHIWAIKRVIQTLKPATDQ